VNSIQSLAPPKTLVEQVYEKILDAICNGTLAPGDRVTQDDLAESLQVSRQPVMTALGQLKQQGFLIERGRRGLQVAPADLSRFDAIYELRSALEPLAASLAAVRANPGQIATGESLVAHGRATAASADPTALLLADVSFHQWVYRTSGNPLIVESMEANWQHLRRAMGEVLRHPSLALVVWDEHDLILKAIAAGDAERAGETMKQHVTTAHARVSELLPAPPPPTSSA
jgi:DNA-binding GntR family transcriptional regulator